MRSDVYLDSTFCKPDRQLVGVIGAQHESSLFSSSLSDLVNHKLKLSPNKFPSGQPQDETGHTINRLLPDEEELFSGIVDELGLTSHTNAIDELDDIDLFTCSGGIELESDDLSQSHQTSVPYSRDLNQFRRSIPIHENSHNCNGFQSFSHAQLGNRGIPSCHPNSHHMRLPNVGHIVPDNTLDAVGGIAYDIRPTVSEKVNFDLRHLGMDGHAMELCESALAYSPNGINIHQSMTSKSSSYQHHHLRSLLMPNSPSFLNNNHTPNLGRLPGSPGAPHLMMNMASPVHQLQVGSAPAVKASIWDAQRIYSRESGEASDYQMGIITGFSLSHTPDVSSHGSFSHVKKTGVHSPQQISHMFHERNVMNGSYGSTRERVRGRRNEINLSHADRKHYELNVGRILRGEDCRTTLMIKNIPNKYTSKMLLATIDEEHRGKYDFIYLPIDFKNKCNMGYAFINMVGPLQIVAFHQTFEGRKWEKFNSVKVATLAYARIQGKAALIAHFRNSSLMNEDRRCHPILFHTDGPNAGDQEPFPVGTGFQLKHGRSQSTANEDAN